MAAQRPFYGWYVVGALFVVSTTTSGFIFYSITVLLDAFVTERAFPVGLTSLATASFFIAAGFAGVVAGRLIDKIDARSVIITGAAVAALALAGAGFLHATWQLFLFHVVFGLGFGFCGLVPITTVVAHWFHARRSLALSIASTGLSLGGFLVTPAAGYFVAHYGLASVTPWLALGLLIGIVPATVLFVRSRPRDMGLKPDGGKRGRDDPIPEEALGVPFHEARRSRFFLGVTGAYVFVLCAQIGAFAHLYRLGSTRAGISIAGLIVALAAASSMVSRLVAGWLLFKVKARTFALGVCAIQATGLIFFALATSGPLLVAAALVFGIAFGNIVMMHPLLLAEAFGTRDYGRIYATSQFVTVIGLASGPALAGLIYESAGYLVAYLALAAISCVGLTILALAGHHRR
jgi:MFS family permease